MSNAATGAPPTARKGHRDSPARRRVREALTSAAFELFLAKGYEETTVEEIADVAGVARRTFFRYFPSKEDVVFPDHDERLNEVHALLEAADPSTPPLEVICAAARTVLEMYVEDPAVSVKRYELIRRVEALRNREIASVSRYTRVFSDYLRRRFADMPDGGLRAETAAAAMAAAHNYVLRSWLVDGGGGDVEGRAQEAFRFVLDSFTPGLRAGREKRAPTPSPEPDDVIVTVVRSGAPLWRVMQHIESAMGRLEEDGQSESHRR